MKYSQHALLIVVGDCGTQKSSKLDIPHMESYVKNLMEKV